MLYRPNTTQNAAMLAASPFQKVAINLIADRSQGEYFSQFEGDSIYFDNVDAPFLVSFVTPQTNIVQTFVAREGLQVKAAFKGLFITHPNYTSPGLVQSFKATMTIGKGSADLSNNLNQPTWGSPPSMLVGTDTALTYSGAIAIPPGARVIRHLEMSLVFATVTSIPWTVGSDAPAELCNGITQPAFTTPNFLQGSFNTSIPIANLMKFSIDNIALPQSARQLNFSIIGTGLAHAFSGQGSWTGIFE